MSDILNDVKKLFDDVAEAAAPVVEQAKEKLSDLGEKAAPVVEQAKTKIKEAAEHLTVKEETKCAQNDETKSAETEKKPDSIGDIAAPIIKKTKEVWQEISEKTAPALDSVKEAVNTAADEVKKNVKVAADYLQGIETPKDPNNKFFDGLEQEAKDLKAGAEDMADKLEDMLHDLMGSPKGEQQPDEKSECEEKDS